MEWIPIRPAFRAGSRGIAILRACARDLAHGTDFTADEASQLQQIRALYLREALEGADGDNQLTRLCVSALCDLRGQAWSIRVTGDVIYIAKPIAASNSPDEKLRVRTGLLVERDAQLREPSTGQFIAEMETRRHTAKGWVSIYSLMRDGRELAERLEHVSQQPLDERDDLLAALIQPYVQLVDDSNCEETGIPLKSIWRYFRHTWVSPHKTVPGRNLWFLIRDAGAPYHPVVGIAALSSPFVQLSLRDNWIGWSSSAFLHRLKTNPEEHEIWSGWLRSQLRSLIDEIYFDDLLADGTLALELVDVPTEETIARLQVVAERARTAHYAHGTAKEHKVNVSDWRERSQTWLFVWKRAAALADLLSARKVLNDAGFTAPVVGALERVLQSSEGKRAISQILRRVKGRHVGHDLADITVCGAVAPYNALLGGKLVALLMTSPEVARAYEDHYAETASIIASGVAGRPVTRRPRLVLLGTTSLYGSGSSQYNRLSMSLDSRSPDPVKVRYIELGLTEGYGSFHLSNDTMSEARAYLAQQNGGRTVKYIFGEGVNPRMREVRNALDRAGLPSDDILRHEARRVIYAIPLASNFRDILLGVGRTPDYLLPQEDRRATSDMIVAHWRTRWLNKRIDRQETMRQLREHRLTFPVNHGARVSSVGTRDDDEQRFGGPEDGDQYDFGASNSW